MPLRKRISEEKLLRYNGMLISVFELLADAREQVAAVNATSKRCATSGSPRADLQAALAGAGEPRPAGAQAGGDDRRPGARRRH